MPQLCLVAEALFLCGVKDYSLLWGGGGLVNFEMSSTEINIFYSEAAYMLKHDCGYDTDISF